MLYLLKEPLKCPRSAIVSMGTTLKAKRNSPEHRAIVLDRLRKLSPNQREVCRLHLVEGHSLDLVGEWLDKPKRQILRYLNNAVLKVPELRKLRIQAEKPAKRPRFFQLSQLHPTERGPFNADEL
jgi:DNA-directed RNA polymerase specialized sigma24 family protein